MRSSRIPYIICFSAFFLMSGNGCSRLDESIYIEARLANLVLHNNSADTLYFAVFGNHSNRQTHWQPCDNPLRCNDSAIEPGRSRSVPYETIQGWMPGTNVMVYWYSLMRVSGTRGDYKLEGPSTTMVPTPRKTLLGS